MGIWAANSSCLARTQLSSAYNQGNFDLICAEVIELLFQCGSFKRTRGVIKHRFVDWPWNVENSIIHEQLLFISF